MAACSLASASLARFQSENGLPSKNAFAMDGVIVMASVMGVFAYRVRLAASSTRDSDQLEHDAREAGTYRKSGGRQSGCSPLLWHGKQARFVVVHAEQVV